MADQMVLRKSRTLQSQFQWSLERLRLFAIQVVLRERRIGCPSGLERDRDFAVQVVL